MNFTLAKTANLILLMALGTASLVCVDQGSERMSQTNQVSTHDPLQAFVGTWTAQTPGESTPYLFLRIKESNGKLTGTTTHVRIKVAGKGEIVGSPGLPGESPLADLNVSGGDLGFTWNGDPRLRDAPAKFVVQGTQQAVLVLILAAERWQETQTIMKDSPGATGFNPVIVLRRETEAENEIQPKNSAQHWEATFMARLINTAEAQYKFANGHYADYRTLLDSGQLKETDGHEFTISPRDFESATDPLPGYRLRLLVASDAGSYQLSIRKKTADCGMSLFTDETGVIFEGHAAECAEKSK